MEIQCTRRDGAGKQSSYWVTIRLEDYFEQKKENKVSELRYKINSLTINLGSYSLELSLSQ